jgi:Uma2 family endonuclease
MAIRQPRPAGRAYEGDGPSEYDGKRMSEAEYLALPEVKPYLEYVDGVVRQKPMPNEKHAAVVTAILLAFARYAETHGGRPRVEMRTRSKTGYRLPDASFFSADAVYGDDATPSVAVEVRSPRQPLHSLRDKCRAFRDAGVVTCWLNDPDRRTAELFEGDAQGLAVTVLESAAMPGFSVALADLFKVLDR